jgi:predicted enzyme related to lactoylglutathione lyase
VRIRHGWHGSDRLHLDIEVDDIDAERDRLVAAGASVVADLRTDAHGRFQVMLDPEGNEFCLVN